MKVQIFLLCSIIIVLSYNNTMAARLYIAGEFNGCEYGKLYELMGGGILECREYRYSYYYSPEVRTDGREVITIGNEKINAYIYDGSVIETQVDGEFEGCDFDKRINFTNGLVFVCSNYYYFYSFMPRVKIFIINDRSPQVFINDKEYKGILYRR